MNVIIPIYKPVGKTPLEMITQLKEKYPELVEKKMSYAGRLDPMAEGLLLILVGEENKKRKQYESLIKRYTFQTIFGVSTDSYDLLGRITATQNATTPDTEWIKQMLRRLSGISYQPYPPFSSRTVQGKPLYYWTRKQLLHTIKVPQKKVHITAIDLLDSSTITGDDLLVYIENSIPFIRGDFRQEEILRGWRTVLSGKHLSFPIITAQVTCSSGTYVRGLVHALSEMTQIPMTTYAIKRIAIGEYTLDNVRYLVE